MSPDVLFNQPILMLYPAMDHQWSWCLLQLLWLPRRTLLSVHPGGGAAENSWLLQTIRSLDKNLQHKSKFNHETLRVSAVSDSLQHQSAHFVVFATYLYWHKSLGSAPDGQYKGVPCQKSCPSLRWISTWPRRQTPSNVPLLRVFGWVSSP